MTNADVFRPTFDLGEFRFALARYAKLLIRARAKCERAFLSPESLAAWGLSGIATDPAPAWRLLSQAADALGHLNMEYLPRCGSGGVEETDESTPVGRLIQAAVGLAQMGDGGGPWHHGALRDAARNLKDGKPVDWARLVDWALLPAIRRDLDLLPKPADNSEAMGRLERIEAAMESLAGREQAKEHYSVEEFAKMVGKAEFTVREWCRLGRISPFKKLSGRGAHKGWVIPHEELLRYRREGLLKDKRGLKG